MAGLLLIQGDVRGKCWRAPTGPTEPVEVEDAGRALAGVLGSRLFGEPGFVSASAYQHGRPISRCIWAQAKKKVEDLDLLQQCLRVLVAPGASLGGARPKANIQDRQGNLWIAKFPAAEDEHDWARREMLVHQLACDSVLDLAAARLERIGTGQSIFVTKRFDMSKGRSVAFGYILKVTFRQGIACPIAREV